MSARGVRTIMFTSLACFAAACASRAPDDGSPAVVVRQAFAPEALVAGDSATATMAAYFVIDNRGAADTLDGLSSPIASRAGVHAEMDHGGTRMMMAADTVEVPARAAVRFAPGGRHVMLEGLTSLPRAGDSLALLLRLRRGGDVHVTVPVIRYVSIDSATHAAR